MDYRLRLTARQHAELKAHLFPGDGKEAVALALCGRRAGSDRHVFVVHRIFPVPSAACQVRTPERVTWSTDILEELLPMASRQGFAVLKVHSHPGGYASFSQDDDASDRSIFASIASWLDNDAAHVSVVLLPDGHMFGRIVKEGLFGPLSSLMVVGDDLSLWPAQGTGGVYDAFALRHAQLFGSGTTAMLKQLTVGVVGCSGTGSIVIEQLARLGTGRLVLVDPDKVEEKNLNRIINSSKEDAYLGRPKVEVLARGIARMGLGLEVLPLPLNLATPEAVMAIAECDVVFGCMDSVEGRHLLNRLASFYTLPYIDVGIRLDADGRGGIAHIAGAVHYLQPGHSSLLTRGVYRMKQVEAEEIRRTNPEIYREQLRAGYLRGVVEDRPAVISVNMLFASMAVNELLARLHPYRNETNAEFAVVRGSLTELHFEREPEGEVDQGLVRHVGRGDRVPLLDRPVLS